MAKKISIIVPCYNVENYIERCMESLINQTIGLNNLELIFVNDASTDHTLEILKSYENLYQEDILVIDLEENIKQGGARNIGIQYATSDYIGFVDSDDWVELAMFEKLYEKALQYNCDMVSCGYKRVLDVGTPMGRTGKEDRFYRIDTDQERRQFLLNGVNGGIWCSIYRKQLIMDNEIFFPERLTYEDNLWLPMVQLYISTHYVLEEYLYHYFYNMNSTIVKRNSLHHFDRLTIELKKLEEYNKRGVLGLFYNEIEFQFLKLFYVNTLNLIFTRFDTIPIDILKLMQKTVTDSFPNYKNNCYLKSHFNNGDEYLLGLIELEVKKEVFEKIASEFKEGKLLVII